jgi:hypothetical protein
LRLHDSPLFVLKLHAGVLIRESIKAACEEITKAMYVAKSQSQTTAAAAKIDCWIMELRGQKLHQNLFLLEIQIQKSIRTHYKTLSSQPNVQRHSKEIRKRTSYGESASNPCNP